MRMRCLLLPSPSAVRWHSPLLRSLLTEDKEVPAASKSKRSTAAKPTASKRRKVAKPAAAKEADSTSTTTTTTVPPTETTTATSPAAAIEKTTTTTVAAIEKTTTAMSPAKETASTAIEKTTTTTTSSSRAFGYGNAETELGSEKLLIVFVGLSQTSGILNIFVPLYGLHFTVQNVHGQDLTKGAFYYASFDSSGGLLNCSRVQVPDDGSVGVVMFALRQVLVLSRTDPLINGGIAALGLVRQVDEVKPIRTTTQRDTKVHEARIAFAITGGSSPTHVMCVSLWGTAADIELNVGQVVMILNAKHSRFHDVVRLNVGDLSAIVDLSKTSFGKEFKLVMKTLLEKENDLVLPEGLQPWKE